jgi:hypothetical protein
MTPNSGPKEEKKVTAYFRTGDFEKWPNASLGKKHGSPNKLRFDTL